jgi:thiol-disulfide isomerase/thioredoxin
MRSPIAFLFMCLLVGLIGCQEAAPAKKSPDAPKKSAAEVELKAIKLAELTEAINAHKGKIVVVDVWATFCPPCKAEFPHLVELHHKYAKDVVCMSVTVDEEKDKDAALKFLKKQEATFLNYQVDYGDLQNDWVFSGVPVVRVYSPSGKVAEQFTNSDPDKKAFTYAEVEQAVQKLLKK